MAEDVENDVGAELTDFLGSDAAEDSGDKTSEVDEKPLDTQKEDVVAEKTVAKTADKVDTKVDSRVDTKSAVKTEKTVVEKETDDDLSAMSDKELRSLVRGLRTRVDDAHGRLISAGATKVGQAETGVDKKTEQKIEQKVEAEVLNFMKDVNMDELIDSPEALNKLLVNVYNRAITDAESRAVEKVLRSIPQLVVSYASRHASMAEMVRDFYNTNQDLVPVKRTVATVANEVAAEHPDWEVKDVFEEAASRARKLLGIQKRTRVEPSSKGKDPAFVRQRPGARRTADTSQMNDLQKEIADTLTE